MPPERSGLILVMITLLWAWVACESAARADGGEGFSRSRGARLSNPSEVRKRLGLTPAYDGVNPARMAALKIAVLDYGFDGLENGPRYLPDNAEVVEHYDPDFVQRHSLGDPNYRKPFEPGNRHGRLMAQIVWGVTGSDPLGPKFFLLNASGPTLLRRAVRYAIEARVDVILFSGSFEGGGDGDGRGPINRIVDEAVGAGIVWINASGNDGGRVYNGPIRVLSDGYLRLRGGSDVAALRFRNRVDENDVTVTLTWNDYRDAEDAGTDKDLDLFVEDWAGRLVGSGTKTQVLGETPTGPETSRNPRERVVLPGLPANPVIPNDPDYCYRIRVRARSNNFTAADRLRILVSDGREPFLSPSGAAPQEALEFVDATGDQELYPPADHPLALTVGDPSPLSSVGPTADHRVKPELLIEDSRAFFSDGQVTTGSSNAAAYFAGVVLVLKGAEPRLKFRDLAILAREGPTLAERARTTAEGKRAVPIPESRRALRLWRTPTRDKLTRLVGPGG
ncbi:MAG: S8 family serine peptidase [Isosphaeraceae bacterium]